MVPAHVRLRLKVSLLRRCLVRIWRAALPAGADGRAASGNDWTVRYAPGISAARTPSSGAAHARAPSSRTSADFSATHCTADP